MLKMPRVRDFIKADVISLQPDMDIHEAIGVLLREKLPSAPVVDEHRRVIGMLSEKDCLMLLSKGVEHDATVPHGVVREYMTLHVVAVSPQMDIYFVAGLFLKHPFRQFPVLQREVLVGIIGRTAVLRAVESYLRDGGHTPSLTARRS